MVLTNYPLSSFAVCADPNAGARAAARERHKEKVFNYASNSLKYFNTEADVGRKLKFIQGTGRSRQQSDIREAVLNRRSAGLTAKEKLNKAYASSQYVNEGGGSRTAGRNQVLALMQQEGKIDAGISNFAGRGQGILLEKQRRLESGLIAGQRKRAAVTPEFGAPVTMPGRDTGAMFMGALSTGLSIASLFVGSDIRMKEDIEQVGVSPDGHKIYEFRYIGKPTRYRGVMAQEVAKIDPMAVGIRQDGYLGVNYGKIDVDMEVIS